MFHCAPTLLAYSPAPLGGTGGLWSAPASSSFYFFHIQAHTNTKGRQTHHIARHYHKHTSVGLMVSILLCLSYMILNINLTATLPSQQWKRKRSTNMASLHKIGWKNKIRRLRSAWMHMSCQHIISQSRMFNLSFFPFHEWLSGKIMSLQKTKQQLYAGKYFQAGAVQRVSPFGLTAQ